MRLSIGLLAAHGLLAVSLPSLDSDRSAAVEIDPVIAVAVDSSRHEVVLTAGPYRLPAMMPSGGGMAAHGESHDGTHDTRIHRFDWPVEGWVRGFRVELRDGRGDPLPRELIHHVIVVNFSRRQLIYPAAERLLGAGTETDDAAVPPTVGVPLAPGAELGVYVAWGNETGHEVDDVHLRLTLLWLPANQMPQPIDALPIYLDVNLTIGGSNTFDIPAGRSETAHEFTVPVGGRLLGVGGHLHDYGVAVRLEDAETGKRLAQVEATRNGDGRVTAVGRQLFGVRGRGLRLKAEHRYRIVGVYDNPTGATLEDAAMAHMVGLFVPDDMARWPAIDENDPEYRRDLESLDAMGGGGAAAEHHEHGDAAAPP